MPHTYSRVLLHLIFSTRNRDPIIAPEFRERLYKYIAGIIRHSKGDALAITGTADHVHMLVVLPLTHSVSDFVRVVKSNSSKWIRENHPRSKFAWQRGYAVFSVSESNALRVCEYINGQHDHHRRVTFQEEYRAFLRKHGIEFNERFIWD